jgi:23S rRNA (uridine2552-2'-O)-methyltransferase
MNDWINRQKHDHFVRKRNEKNVIARSYFKIEEIFQEFFSNKKTMRILDLGSAPGGWSQYFKQNNHYVIGIDLLPMKIQIDEFYQQDILDEIPNVEKVNIICSDIAHNLSGNKTIDQAIMCEIGDKITECIHRYLSTNGSFVMKVFSGDSLSSMQKHLKPIFETCKVFKPQASRSESSETYIIAQKYKPKHVNRHI